MATKKLVSPESVMEELRQYCERLEAGEHVLATDTNLSHSEGPSGTVGTGFALAYRDADGKVRTMTIRTWIR